MPAWLNRAVYQMPRNGTTSHTVDPTSSTNLVLGSAFAPTAGRLLIVVIEGAVTSSTPSGWTLPSGGSAVNNTGLYVWYRTAASGSNAFSTTHNASNYPVVVAIYEFAAGSTFVKSVAATGLSYNGANPALSSLTGTNTVMAVKARGVPDSDTYTYTWAATGSPVEDWDYRVAVSGTDGYAATLAYADGVTATSWQPTATNAVTAGSYEALTFAVNVAAAAGGTSYPVSGDIQSTTSIDGKVSTASKVTGPVSSTSTSDGKASLSAATSGAFASTSVIDGLVTATSHISGSIQSTSTVSGYLDQPGLTGHILSTSSVSGWVTVTHRVSGDVQSTSQISGRLSLPPSTSSVYLGDMPVTLMLGDQPVTLS